MKVLKWAGILLAVLIGLIVVGVGIAYAVTSAQMGKTYKYKAESIPIRSDDDTLERGKYLVEGITGCADCHAKDLGGKALNDEPMFGRLWSANLTSGKGGIADEFSNRDWIKILRHGVNREGKPLALMPSVAFYNMTKEDLSAVIAYAKSVPPVDRVIPKKRLGPLAYVMFATGNLPSLLPALEYDHSASRPTAERGVTKEYGRYLVAIGGCRDCHRKDLAGGPIAGAPPGTPAAPNITPAGAMGQWSAQGFIKAMRAGETPYGHEMDEFMPWKPIGKMNDDDLTAMFLYLKSVPEKIRAE